MKKFRSNQVMEITILMERLANIHRYPMWEKNRNINVAEHSFRVAILSMIFADIAPNGINQVVLLRKALLHDFGEALMGDITYRVKHASEEAERFFESLENSYIDEAFVDNKHLRAEAKSAKEGNEGFYIKVADMFDNILYGASEIRTGNFVMFTLVKRCVEYLVRMTSNTELDFVGAVATRIYRECDSLLNLNDFSKDKLEERYGLRP